MAEEWITVKEAASLRKVTERTFLNLIKRGVVEARKEGRSWKVKKESAEKVSENLPNDSEVVSILKAELQERNAQVNKLQEQLEKVRQDSADASERHDTIVLNLTRQNQLMLEDKSIPWYRRWFRKAPKS